MVSSSGTSTLVSAWRASILRMTALSGSPAYTLPKGSTSEPGLSQYTRQVAHDARVGDDQLHQFLFDRLGQQATDNKQQIDRYPPERGHRTANETHWLRHTTLTWVERSFGYAVARAYAGHTDSGGDAGITTTYVRASAHEIAAALAALTGEPHPLA
jgi:hypothetical protein